MFLTLLHKKQKNMKVLYDYQAFQIQNHGGVSRGFTEVISRLNKFGVDWEIAIKDSNNVHLYESLPQVCLSGNFLTKLSFCQKHKMKGKGLYYDIMSNLHFLRNSDVVNKKKSLALLERGDFDVFHATFFDTYFLSKIECLSGKPLVITIHDMTPELFPEQYRGSKQIVDKKHLVKFASHIIVPSQNTKEDVVKMLQFPEEKIQVIHWGADLLDESYLDALDRLVFEPYLLYVGARDGYKGFSVFLKDFQKIAFLHPELRLVCTGKEFTLKELSLISELKLKDKVIQKFVTQKELHSLYRYAKAFVYPSLYEGFGIPIFEAFSCHCPVFLNDASCFREIGGNAAVYFNQDECKSNFSSVFEEYLKDEMNNRKELSSLSMQRIIASSWDKTAEEYANFYKSIINGDK